MKVNAHPLFADTDALKKYKRDGFAYAEANKVLKACTKDVKRALNDYEGAKRDDAQTQIEKAVDVLYCAEMLLKTLCVKHKTSFEVALTHRNLCNVIDNLDRESS